MEDSFLLFAVVGFLAQIVDGALGMAYGVVSSSVLLGFGVPPAAASASVHAAELFTTAASAGSHVWHRNVNWRLFRVLAPVGILGGVTGTYLVTAVDGDVLRPYVAGYLGLMGLYILFRAWRVARPIDSHKPAIVAPLGLVGGFADAVEGGGWGPVVTTGLVGTGGAPREMIGTVNTVEFFLTFAVSLAFVLALMTGHWEDAGGLVQYASAVAGLIVGGVLAAPLAGYVTRMMPPRILMIAVGVLVSLLAIYQISRLL
ncbi:MAG: sulfite exporter TauE/SafE family protein [Tabrizicola sp.]|uniref:sulfite exporter TauE/SafE family protein n=1 Tax=Tabrizicola sp. TaxID=2005166 RepID=UPI002AB89392|nr:sulfite exporter TauE/SafE family protein [Tabrizicola sp.]MDZ4087081.1 sulfite exporter TauE/SafE family protein [Tabrizicola sp.]